MATLALDYLASKAEQQARPVYVLFGEETFLIRLALKAIRGTVLENDDGLAEHVFDGRQATLHAVLDELSTRALFGGSQRLVIVEQADDFVSEHRAKLEHYTEHPRSSGVLALVITSFPSNTKLYKLTDKHGLAIDCRAPAAKGLPAWLIKWAKQQYGKTLEREAAELMVDLVGAELGLLDQELAKVAAWAGEQKELAASAIAELVGGWRTKTTWEMIDLAIEGQAAEALKQLDRLIDNGETPVGLLAQISFTLRRFGGAARLIVQADADGKKISVRDALDAAGVQGFFRTKAEQQLRKLGRGRAGELYRWLVKTDLDMKGDSPAPPRMVLEQLLVKIART